MNDGVFIDSNVFLRHLLDDNASMSDACHALLKSVEMGEVRAWTSPIVMAEIAWVLGGGVYKFAHEVVARTIMPLCQIERLGLEHRNELLRACELFGALNIDFADAYHAALLEARDARELYSYDRDFDKVPGLTRMEP